MVSSDLTRTHSVRTLTELLRNRADRDPTRIACICLDDSGGEARRLTYGDLDSDARACAAAIAARVPRGERVALMTTSGPDFIRGFFGCLYAGTVVVPIHPGRKGPALERARHVVADARPAAILARGDLLV